MCGAAEISALSSARLLKLMGISDTLLLGNASQVGTDVLKEALRLMGKSQKLSSGASQQLKNACFAPTGALYVLTAASPGIFIAVVSQSRPIM